MTNTALAPTADPKSMATSKSRLPADASAKVPASHLPDGFFVMTRGQSKGEVQGRNVKVTFHVNDSDLRVELFAGVQPTEDEQSVCYALIAIASQPRIHNGQSLYSTTCAEAVTPETLPILCAIQPDLFATRSRTEALAAFKGDCLIGRATITEIARVAHIGDSASELARVRNALLNLNRITATEFDGENVVRPPTNWIGFDQIQVAAQKGRPRIPITFGINQRLTETVLGDGRDKGGRYVRILLAERNQLPSQAAKLLHSSLCRDVWPSRPMVEVEIETLFGRIYLQSKVNDISQRAMRAAKSDRARARIREMRYQMRQSVKRALDEIGKLDGWKVTIEKRGQRQLVTVIRTASVDEKISAIQKGSDGHDPFKI